MSKFWIMFLVVNGLALVLAFSAAASDGGNPYWRGMDEFFNGCIGGCLLLLLLVFDVIALLVHWL